MKRMNSFQKNNKTFFTKGFTLVEFILILSIFSIMAGVTMFNFNGFRSNVAMENLAYDVALSIQNIQQRAASGFNASTTSGSTSSGTFQGILFTSTSSTVGPNKFSNEFILFKDLNNNQKYDTTATPSELIDKIKIQYSEYIENIEIGTMSGTTFSATGASSIGSNDDIAILFKRPWLDAYFFKISGGTAIPMISNSDQYMRITLASGSGTNIVRKYIIISRAGQVSVR